MARKQLKVWRKWKPLSKKAVEAIRLDCEKDTPEGHYSPHDVYALASEVLCLREQAKAGKKVEPAAEAATGN
jgi:hypothetical protein